MSASEFWSLDRDERRKRIEHAEDTDTCSACCKPILPGQPRNGSHHAHYDCTDLGPPPSKGEIEKLSREIAELITSRKIRR